jgi:hypothetical protein
MDEPGEDDDGAVCLGRDDASRADTLRLARSRALAGREALAAEVEALLFRLDPIGIAHEDNADEYRGEAESIVVRLPRVTSEAELLALVHAEFVRWFDADTAGPPARYRAVAAELWARVRPGA